MQLGPPGARRFIDDAGTGNEILTVADASIVLGMAIENLPRVVRDLVEIENGDVVIITNPMDDTAYETLRLYHGPPSALVERTIASFGQSRSGDATVSFFVGGTPAQLMFRSRDTTDAALLWTGVAGNFVLDITLTMGIVIYCQGGDEMRKAR